MQNRPSASLDTPVPWLTRFTDACGIVWPREFLITPQNGIVAGSPPSFRCIACGPPPASRLAVCGSANAWGRVPAFEPAAVDGASGAGGSVAVGEGAGAAAAFFSLASLSRFWRSASFESAGGAAEFANFAGKMLAVAQDVHLAMRAGERRIVSYHREAFWAVNFNLLQKIIPQWTKRHDFVYSGILDNGAHYLCITSLPANDPATGTAWISGQKARIGVIVGGQRSNELLVTIK